MNQDAQSNLIELSRNPYPGRGIILGLSRGGRFLIQVYWIMGRSGNSRNRVFEHGDNGRVFTKAADPAKMEDPSLIIYDAMIENRGVYAVSNGHQTKDVAEGGPAAMWTWDHEPDAPNFTPRIAGVCYTSGPVLAEIAIARRSVIGKGSDHILYSFQGLEEGVGMCVTTYMGDGNPLPAFHGEPYPLPLIDGVVELAQYVWGCLNEENRVALAVKFIDRQDGKSTIYAINKYQKVQ